MNWQQAKAFKAIFWHTPDLNDKAFDSSRFSAEGAFISVPTALHCEESGERGWEKKVE